MQVHVIVEKQKPIKLKKSDSLGRLYLNCAVTYLVAKKQRKTKSKFLNLAHRNKFHLNLCPEKQGIQLQHANYIVQGAKRRKT